MACERIVAVSPDDSARGGDRPQELEEHREEKGRLAGDRFVRIVRPHREEFRRAARGFYVATERVLEPETPFGRLYEGVRRVLIWPRATGPGRARRTTPSRPKGQSSSRCPT